MIILFGLWEGIRDLSEHKLRSALTLTGVALGVGSLLAMLGLIGGEVASMREGLEESGNVNKIQIVPAPPPPSQADRAEQSPGLTYDDVVAIRNSRNPLIAWIAPTVTISPTIFSRDRKANTWLLGCEKETLQREKLTVLKGRFITDLDLELKNRVAVVGSVVAAQLWTHPEEEAVGSTITIQGIQFKVIGLFPHYMTESQKRAQKQGIQAKNEALRKKRGVALHNWYDDAFPWKNRIVDIPITTMFATFKSSTVDAQGVDWGPDRSLSDFIVGPHNPKDKEAIGNQIRSILLQTHHGVEDFKIELYEDEMKWVDKMIFSARVVGGLIASIGMIVGGMGIMNIMMASIMDRIREIGIRRSVGATPLHIFSQVMMESILLACAGGVAGIFMGLGFMKFLVAMYPVDTSVAYGVTEIVISFASSVAVGILAGLYPAIKAARLSVVQALLFE